MLTQLLRQWFIVFSFAISVTVASAQGSLSNGATQSGSLPMGGSATWSFSAPANSYWAGTVSTPSTAGMSVRVVITRVSDGYVLASNHNLTWSYGGYNYPANDWTIQLIRDDSMSGSDSYTITNTVLPGPPTVQAGEEGGPMADEQALSGSVSYGDLDDYWFNANASDPGLNVEMDYSGTLPYLSLVGPNGVVSQNCGAIGTGQYSCSFYNNLAGTIYAMVSPRDSTTQSYTLILHNSTAAPPTQRGKSVGGTCSRCELALTQPQSNGTLGVKDPINISSGDVFEAVVDYTTAGQNPLALIRYYNSAANLQSTPFAASLGTNWRTNYDRYLHVISATMVSAERPDGQILTFHLAGSTWTPDTDSDYRLTSSGTPSTIGTTWTLTDHQDIKEAYTTISSTEAQLNSITTQAGYVQTLSYSGSQLSGVADSYSRNLGFTYTGSNLTGVTTPDTLQLTYGFDAPSGHSRLTTVEYNTSPTTSQTYLYENASFPFAMTGITDENGARYATWGYDTQGRGTSSQLGSSGADATTISYAADSFSATVTNALGLQTTYKFKTLQDVSKIVEIDRHDPAGTLPDASETLAYDTNGYLSKVVDFNSNQTLYTNDAYGDPTYIYEAYGSPVARTTHTVYDTTWVRKPKTVTFGNLTTGYTYDASAATLLTKVYTDGSGVHGTYAPASLTWTYTYTATGQLATVKAPRTDVTVQTSYGYTGGTLTSITDPLSHVTNITSYTPGGRPLTVVDPNSVTTTLTYDTRTRLKTSSVPAGGVARLTTYGYDAVENLTSTTLPGGGIWANTYDDAHRLTNVTSKFTGGAIDAQAVFTLDADGNATATNYKNASGTVKLTRGDSFDALGRRLTHTGGASQVTQYGYDPNSNVTSIIDPMVNPTIVQTFDALNRLSQVTDRAGGITKYTYDAFDRPLTVITPNGATTTYTYNGYEEMVKQVSPDSGTSYYYFDGDNNLTQKKDALSIVANYTYDAGDRQTAVGYPAASSENVTYSWDETGHGFGIGRLTTAAGPAGTFKRSYDERGAITSEGMTRGTTTQTTGYTYSATGNVATITYPSGMIVTQTRDSLEKITGLSLKPTSGGTSQTVLSSVAYDPFGPVTGFNYGNTVIDGRTYDADYRLKTIVDAGSAVVQNLAFGYNANDNLTGVTDAVTSGNSQTLTYDALDRLKTAAGGYGSLTYGYDANGNRNSYNGATWTYTANSNRVTAIGSNTVTPNANGSITAVAGSPAMGFAYLNSGRLGTVTSAGSTVLTYVYDAFGRRANKTDTAQRFFQYGFDDQVLEQSDNTYTTKRDTIYLNGMPVATFVPGGTTGTLSFLHDGKNDIPRAATSASQAVGWSFYTADPFAAGTASVGSIANDLRYPGQEYELADGQFYNRNRDYIPGWGRYLEGDPIGLNGGQDSTYAYAGGNPLRFLDRSGKQLYKGIIGLVLMGAYEFEQYQAISHADPQQAPALPPPPPPGTCDVNYPYGAYGPAAVPNTGQAASVQQPPAPPAPPEPEDPDELPETKGVE